MAHIINGDAFVETCCRSLRDERTLNYNLCLEMGNIIIFVSLEEAAHGRRTPSTT